MKKTSADTSEHLVIIGFGWVGQANALALALSGRTVSYYDPATPGQKYPEYAQVYGHICRLDDPLKRDGSRTHYLVCVGDRVDGAGNQDISLISKALASLKSAQGSVTLRSTVLPHFLKELDFDFLCARILA